MYIKLLLIKLQHVIVFLQIVLFAVVAAASAGIISGYHEPVSTFLIITIYTYYN